MSAPTAVSTAPPLEEIAAEAPAVDREGRFPTAAMEALRRAGLLGLGVPEAHGGLGGGPVEFVAATEQVAGACASTGMVYVMHVVAAHTLLAGTSEEEPDGPRHEALRSIARGEHLTTLAYSERGSRGHFWAQVSRARADGDKVVIDADKTWSTGAGHVDSYVTATGSPAGDGPLDTELYLVPAGSDGLDASRRFDGLGLRGNASAPLALREVRVSADRRLGGPGSGLDLMLTATLPWFVLGSAACSVGIAEAALEAAVGHATRGRFEYSGSTLADVPGVRERLARAKLRHAEARSYLYAVARELADGGPQAQLGVLGVKASAAEAAVEATDMCLRIGGGAAYSKHGPLERHMRDARAASVMAPSTDVLHDMLGKALTGQELF
jgi:alkylation response protein AidB-like acyl-CoA dehydrogenase